MGFIFHLLFWVRWWFVFLQETYEIVDALGILPAYSINVPASNTRYAKYTLPTLPSNYQVEFTAKSTSDKGNRWGIGEGTTERIGVGCGYGTNSLYGVINNNGDTLFNNGTYTANTDLHIIITVQNNKASLKINDTLVIDNQSYGTLGNNLNFIYYNTRTTATHTVSDIIVKAL